jgi:hypothetical protein
MMLIYDRNCACTISVPLFLYSLYMFYPILIIQSGEKVLEQIKYVIKNHSARQKCMICFIRHAQV